MTTATRRAATWCTTAAGIVVAGYAAYAGFAWARYGHTRHPRADGDADALLDRFIPEYEVIERHSIRVSAPPEIAFPVACEVNLSKSALVRAIFRAREMILGAKPAKSYPSGLVAQTKALGWGVLAEEPGREIVMGAVTQPWAADVIFRALPPEQFAAFREPGYVKIVWTLRADPDGPFNSIYRTETRAAVTSSDARVKFRRYWAAFSPGIVLIRRLVLRIAKKEAELMSLDAARFGSGAPAR